MYLQINTSENVWKSDEEITSIRPALSLIFSQSTGLFHKYVKNTRLVSEVEWNYLYN